MFPVIIYEDNVVLPEGICYIIAKGGVYLKKDTGLISSITKVEKLSFLKNLIPEVKINIPPISLDLFMQIRLFFRAVYRQYKSEAIVLLYFNEEKQEYKIVAPFQYVSHAYLEYEPNFHEDGFKLVGSIHSHANFSAFHSGIDHRDEASFDGLHITIGDVNKKRFSVSIEVVVNNNRFPQQSEDWILGLVESENQELPFKSNLVLSPEQESLAIDILNFSDSRANYSQVSRYSYFSSKPRHELILPEGKTLKDYSFPKEWLNFVKRKYHNYPNYPKKNKNEKN